MNKAILTITAVILLVLNLLVLNVIAASAILTRDAPLEYPYTRFSHTNDWCMLYTGYAMCWVPHKYCDTTEYGKETEYFPGQLGECPQNTAPVLIIPNLKIELTETEVVRINAECTDADNENTFIKYSGWMDEDTKQTNYNDAGSYEVEVECTDEKGQNIKETVEIEVLNKNRAPVFTNWN